jgi:hypothetical protein
MKNKTIKEDAYKNLEMINSWFNNSDAKASIALCLIGVVLTIIFSNSDFLGIFFKLHKNLIAEMCFINLIYILLIIISMIIFTLGVYFLLKVLIPSLNINTSVKKSFLYFGQVAKYSSFSKYKKDVIDATSDDVLNDVLNQVYINSIICNAKFENFIKGLKFSIIGFVFLLILLIMGIKIYL